MTLSLPLLRRLLEAGTPRPWRVYRCGFSDLHEACGVLSSGPRGVFKSDASDECHHPVSQADADLIANALNALPQLIAIAEAACAWRDEMDFAATRAPGEVFTREQQLISAIDSARKEGT